MFYLGINQQLHVIGNQNCLSVNEEGLQATKCMTSRLGYICESEADGKIFQTDHLLLYICMMLVGYSTEKII